MVNETGNKETVEFKKRTKKKKNPKTISKKDVNSDSSDHDDNDDVNVLAKIQETKRKRMVLSETKRGIDITKDIKVIKKSKAIPTDKTSKNVHDKLRGAFSSVMIDANTGVNSTNDDTTSDQTMRKKHTQAMEEYIRQNMEIPDTDNKEDEHTESKKNAQDRLYEELLNDAVLKNENENEIEGDIGSGGAMLGGTGIAEVILPSSNFQQTKENKSFSKSSHDNDLKKLGVPLNFRRGPSKQKNIAPKQSQITFSNTTQDITTTSQLLNNKNIASNAPSSYSHNFKLHKHQWIQQQKKKEQADIMASQANASEQDDDRVGFQASRNKNNDKNYKDRNKKEDKYWNQFVSKQRNQRPFH